MGAEGAAVRSGYISMGLGIVSLLLPCAWFCSLTFAVALPVPDAVVEWQGGWPFTVASYGLPMSLGLAATIVGIRAAMRGDYEPRTAAANEQRTTATIGIVCGYVSFVVGAVLLLLGWLGSIFWPGG